MTRLPEWSALLEGVRAMLWGRDDRDVVQR